MILVAAVLCTWAVAHGAASGWRNVFHILCHGIPERCLTLFGVPMPICARCTALYAGLIAGLVTFLLLPWLQERPLRIFLYLMTLPIAADGISQAMRLRQSTNSLRVATGLAAGFAFGMWVLSAIQHHEQPAFPSS